MRKKKNRGLKLYYAGLLADVDEFEIFYSTFQKSLPNEIRQRLLEKTISRRSLGEGGS